MYKYLDNIESPEDLKKLSHEELEHVSRELRNFIMDSVMVSGGHLGSSLGTVELSVALHYVFDAPRDKIIWDIGHQSYGHKVLTGRKDKFSTLRQWEGISGFSNPAESIYDDFVGGHSSTSISSAIGIKLGLEMQNKSVEVVAVIGDASIGAGMALEALNHIGSLNSKVIIILNDNSMSISKTKGALSNYFSKVKSSKNFVFMKNIGKEVLNKFPKSIEFLAKKADSLTRITHEANIFEELGFNYIGPMDGHNVENLISILENIKENDDNKPILLHIITKKGCGHQDADTSKDALHGVEGCVIKKDNSSVEKSDLISNSKVFVNSLKRVAEKDESIVAISAAMLHGTGLDDFQKSYPERVFDVGIAEQHAVTLAGGMAKSGLKPFVCIYSTFMQRAYDQVVHDVCLGSLPVRFVMDRAGFVGSDGATHHGVLDYSMFLPLPNVIFMAPAFKEDIEKIVALMVDINHKPSFLRFSKNKLISRVEYEKLGYSFLDNITTGKGQVIQQGNEVAIISLGEVMHSLIRVSEKFKEENKKITLVDMIFAKPVDEDLICRIGREHKTIIVVEEGLSSIFASIVMQVLSKNNLLQDINFKSISLPDFNIEQGDLSHQRNKAHMDEQSLYTFIKSEIK